MAEEESRGTLEEREPHPMAREAFQWIFINYTEVELMKHLEILSSCSISGNRLAEICGETLGRLINGEPVSDRYLLGLAWYLKNVKENK